MKLLLSLVVLCLIGTVQGQTLETIFYAPAKSSTVVRDLFETSDNKIVVGIDFNTIQSGIAKMDDNGAIEWSKRLVFADAFASCSYDVVENSNGNYYLHGLMMDANGQNVFLLEVSPAGIPLMAKKYFLSNSGEYAVNKMRIAPNGDLIFLASLYDQVIIFRTNATGDLIWGKSITNDNGANGKNPGFDVTVLPDGSVIGCGKNENSLSLIKFNQNGVLQFSRTHALGEYLHAKSMEVHPNGNLLIAGVCSITDPIFTFSDLPVLMEINSVNGEIVWVT